MLPLRRAALLSAVPLLVVAAGLALPGGGPAPVLAAGTFDAEMFQLINQDRAGNGVAPLAWNASLSGIGESTPYRGCGYTIAGRAEDMGERDYFSHQILDCGSEDVFTVMQSNGIDYQNAGENIGWSGGITDPVQAAIYQNTLYMNSSPHRANILDSAYDQVGVGSWDTAPGQTWSGGGGAPVADVVISAVEFIQSGSSEAAEVPAIATFWQPAASLGAAPVGTPHAASWGVGDTDVFWRGNDGGLWHEWYSNGWQGPQELSPPGTMASDPYPVSWGPGNLEVFWRGTDGNLWQVDYINGWQGPADLGFGPLDSDPHPVSWGVGNVDVFWKGSDGGLWHAYYANGWHGPQSLGNQIPLATDPHPVSWGPGNIDVFWADASGDLVHQYFADGWSSPAVLGDGPLASAPHPVSVGPGQIEVFWKGTDGGLWEAWFSNGWQGPVGRGGSLASDPVPVRTAPGTLDVFWNDTSDGLSLASSGPGGLSLQSLGDGPFSGQPSAMSWANGNADVFWAGTNGSLWHAFHP